MSASPNLLELTPLIVVGHPRSGTRFTGELLNALPEVCLQGEIPHPGFKEMVQGIKKLGEHISTREGATDRHWIVQRQLLVMSIWRNARPWAARDPEPEARYYGYKRPQHERYFSFYEEVFAERPPIYVYCLRNFVDAFLSTNSRWPERSIEYVANDWMASISRFEKMRRRAAGRVHLNLLDAVIDQGADYLYSWISRLNVQTDLDQIAELSDQVNRNKTVDFGVERRTSLSPEEQAYYESRPELAVRHLEVSNDEVSGDASSVRNAEEAGSIAALLGKSRSQPA